MKDIAKELNLSITTVSFVVNGKCDSISPATIKKVNDLIKKRGFNPNPAARMLRTGKSKTIGLILEDNGNFFFGNVAKIIESIAHKNGYNVFLSSTENNNDTARALIRKMTNSSVDGFIIVATDGIKAEIEKLKYERIPFVLIDRKLPDVDTNFVILNNEKGAYDLTEHLISRGYKNISYISISDGMSQMEDRKNGFLHAMKDGGLEVKKATVLEVSYQDNREKILHILKKHLRTYKELDALFFATNYLGVLGIEILNELQLGIGKDIAVVSFDDNDLFRLLHPSITVAAQPIEEIATQSIDLLLKLLNNDQKTEELFGSIIEPTIIVRNSTPARK